MVMFFGCFSLQIAQAKSERNDTVNLIAPEEVRKVLDQHFVQPDTLLQNEIERAIFMLRAQREIKELLETQGYFSGQVILQSVSSTGVVNVEVIPGQRTVVTEVNIEFRGDLSLNEAQRTARVQQLRSGWPLQTGMPFQAMAWDEAKSALIAQVSRREYAAARLVESSAQVDTEKASASLHVVVDSGPRFLFGELRVSGLERYKEQIVIRQAGFSRGQAYDRDLLLAFQNQLQNLPQFNSVVVNFDTTLENVRADSKQDTAVTSPVVVQIVEAQSRKIGLGIGYSTNNGVRNEINYQSYNFLNHALLLNSALVFEQNRQTVSAGLDTQPDRSGYHLSWNAGGEQTRIQGLETRRDKFGVTRGRTLKGIETGIGLYWQQEQRFPLGGIRETDQALVLDLNLNIRRVDNPLFPMSGTLTELRLGGASNSVLSDQDFVRSHLRHQVWIPLSERDVLLLRIEGGYTAASSRLGIPQEYLFRVGGTQTVRGFDYQSLGFREGSAVVGGRVMATGSVEYTHWFGNWGAALFGDVGGAADIAPALRMSQGYGAGARWRSPVGPLALDYARGKGQPDARLHFAIAVAF